MFASEKTRLDPTDAVFVDVIHSCGGVLGFLQPLGKIDFYPNAGTAIQPGCCCVPEMMGKAFLLAGNLFASTHKRKRLLTSEISEACSHGRSYVYFTESINSKTGLSATKCNSWDSYMNGKCANSQVVLMGEHVDQTASGLFFLRTRSSAPYAYTSEIADNKI